MQTTDLAHSLVLTGRILEFIKKKKWIYPKSCILLMLKPRQKLKSPDSQPSANFIGSLPGFEKENWPVHDKQMPSDERIKRYQNWH